MLVFGQDIIFHSELRIVSHGYIIPVELFVNTQKIYHHHYPTHINIKLISFIVMFLEN